MRWIWNRTGMPLRRRISFSFMALYTVLLLIIILMINLTYRYLMDAQIRERSLYEEQLMVQQLEKFTSNVNSCCNNVILSLNTGFLQYPGAPGFQDHSNYAVNRMFRSGMEHNLLLFGEAGRISVVLETGVIYTQNRVNMRDGIDSNPALYRYFRDQGVDTEGRWFYNLEDAFGSAAGRISYVKSLRDIQTNSTVGYVVICVDSGALRELYQNSRSSSYIYYSVSSADGAPLTLTDLNPAGSLETAARGQSRNYYTASYPVGRQGEWVLLSIVDRRTAMAGANVITAGVLLVGAAFLIAANVVVSLIAKRISNPIRTMAEHMVRYQDRLPDELPAYPDRDEIGVLTDNFNRMIRRNRELFAHVVAEQRQKRHFELALMQAQIKPHFLYNTLDTAYCFAHDGQAENTKRVLKLLADYYRAVLNKGSEWISVAKELESVTNYLAVQKMRYGDLFTYEFHVPSEIRQLRIPKLILQPLVENSIYHGLKPMGGGGLIQITGEMEDEWAILRIWDNGIGMPEEALQDLMGRGELADESDSFGLKNSADRLKLFYGEKSCLDLEPCSRGTTIRIRIYLGMEGEEHL